MNWTKVIAFVKQIWLEHPEYFVKEKPYINLIVFT